MQRLWPTRLALDSYQSLRFFRLVEQLSLKELPRRVLVLMALLMKVQVQRRNFLDLIPDLVELRKPRQMGLQKPSHERKRQTQ